MVTQFERYRLCKSVFEPEQRGKIGEIWLQFQLHDGIATSHSDACVTSLPLAARMPVSFPSVPLEDALVALGIALQSELSNGLRTSMEWFKSVSASMAWTLQDEYASFAKVAY